MKEVGGHRIQRIPPTEHNGRRHTSTITVAVLPEPNYNEFKILEKDLDWKFCRGSGKGGQNRNKLDTAVQLTYLPTRLMVRIESERSQHQNKELALSLLKAKLKSQKDNKTKQKIDNQRQLQIGSGMRGDKIRTISYQNNIVTNHLNEKKMPVDRYIKGFIEEVQ